MLRLSPSLIDSIEFYRSVEWSEEQDAAKLAEIKASIRRDPSPSSEAMLRGRALHKIVENQGRENPRRGLRIDGPDWDVGMYATGADLQRYLAKVRVRRAGMAELLNEIPAGAVHEVKEVWDTGRFRFAVKPDAIHGNTVHEFKTTGKPINDPENYVSTIQWRVYLAALGLQRCRYHVVQLLQKKGVYVVAQYQEFDCLAYPAMRDEINQRAAEAAEFIETLGLTQYITEAP